jgi:hypothetical protein
MSDQTSILDSLWEQFGERPDLLALRRIISDPKSVDAAVDVFWRFYKVPTDSAHLPTKTLRQIARLLDSIPTSPDITMRDETTHDIDGAVVDAHIKSIRTLLYLRTEGRTPQYSGQIKKLHSADLFQFFRHRLAAEQPEDPPIDLVHLSVLSLLAVLEFERFQLAKEEKDFETALGALAVSLLLGQWVVKGRCDSSLGLNGTLDFANLTALRWDDQQVTTEFIERSRLDQETIGSSMYKEMLIRDSDIRAGIVPVLISNIFTGDWTLLRAADVELAPSFAISTDLIAGTFVSLRNQGKVNDPESLRYYCKLIFLTVSDANELVKIFCPELPDLRIQLERPVDVFEEQDGEAFNRPEAELQSSWDYFWGKAIGWLETQCEDQQPFKHWTNDLLKFPVADSEHNRKQFFKIIAKCDKYIDWVDPFITEQSFEVLEAALSSSVMSIRVLTKPKWIYERSKLYWPSKEWTSFKERMRQRGVDAQWRVTQRKGTHDRLILTSGYCWNLPPSGVMGTSRSPGYSEANGRNHDIPDQEFREWWQRGAEAL